MSTYSTTVLAHYAGAPAAVRSALAAALDDAEKAVAGAAAPSTKGTKHDPLKEGAKASEQPAFVQHAAVDAFFGRSSLPAHVVLAELTNQTAEEEGLSYGEAMTVTAKRYPKVAARYAAESV